MTEFTLSPITPEALRACEARARQMRAEAVSHGFSQLFALVGGWIVRPAEPSTEAARA